MTQEQLLDGTVIVIDKPYQWTSFQVVNKIKSAICMNLGQMEEMLTEQLKERKSIFARIGKRYIVNLSFVYKIHPQKRQLALTDFSNFLYQIPVSTEALKKLKDIMVDIKY